MKYEITSSFSNEGNRNEVCMWGVESFSLKELGMRKRRLQGISIMWKR